MNLFHRSACCSLAVATLSAPCLAQRGPVPGFSTATPYLIHYGDWTPSLVTEARTGYKLVILHPSTSNITAADIASIRSGPDSIAGNTDDVKVLAYISVGEDDRPGAPFAADGNGPRIDPRPADATPLETITDPMGLPSPGGTGFASYYLDDNNRDGQPDRNSIFGGYYVNPGDPAWYQILKTKTKAVDGRAGIHELLTTTTGNGYGCDGLFLDTLDTPAPNSFGATFFEWTSKAYRDLVKAISDDNPAKLLLANRGLFFFNPNLKNYAYTLRPHINLLMFESYYTDSSGSGAATAFFDDNKFNFAPKLNAEANRPDGFTVIGLGYTSPGEPPALIAQDFVECQQQQGWLLYRTNPALNALPFNTDAAAWNAANPDIAAPTWDSTAATGADSDPGTPGNQPPAPRVGVQEVAVASGTATVRWDLARDQTGPVKYNLYYTTAAVLDFGTATKIANVATGIPDSYLGGTGAGRYPYEHTLTGLTNGTTYRFAVRAEDALGNEDPNTVVLAATPQANPATFRAIAIDGSFADWDGVPVLAADPVDAAPVDFADVQVANDADYLYVRFTLHTAASPFSDFNTHLFLDTDDNPATGLPVGGANIGSEVMIESGSAYDQRGGGFNEGGVNGIAWSLSPAGPATAFELRISRSATFANGSAPVFGGRTLRLALQDNRGDTTAGILLDFAPAPPPPSTYATINVDGNLSDWAGIPVTGTDPTGDGTPDVASLKVANDADYLYVLVQYNGAVDTNTLNGSPSTFLSVDNDANPGTGFNIYGLNQVGADVSWQNDFPFAQDVATFNRGAVFTSGAAGIAPYFANTTFQEYRIARNATYSIGGGPSHAVFPNNAIRLALWSDHGSAAEFAGAVDYVFQINPAAAAYESWRAGEFTAPELANLLISGDHADPDHDGVVNLLEFALGLLPKTSDPEGLPDAGVMTVGPDRFLTFTYIRRAPVDGVVYTPQSSSDLAAWNSDPGQFTTVSTTSLPGGLTEVEIRLNTPVPAGPNFIRLSASLVP